MELPFESHVKFNEPVTITVLQSDNTICTGRFVDSSSDGMRIKSTADLQVGSLLQLEVGNELMMTEVRECAPGEGEYTAGLLILSWLEKSELKRLLREAVAGPGLSEDALLAAA